jgi:uncharacterized protein YlxW (UPF0749 family)
MMTTETAPEPRPARWAGLLVWPPAKSQLLIGLLAAVLGFALVVQVRTTQESSGLASARQDDLIRIIDDLTSRSERLQSEIAELAAARDRLSTGVDRDAAALEEARRRADTLAILAGTVAAHGRGLVIVIDDPGHAVRADLILDAIQELRDAGAEALMINKVRVAAATYVLDADGGINVDGTAVQQPYTIAAIGESATLDEAMFIPGGVVDTVQDVGGAIRVERSASVVIDALRPLSTPRYARPAPGG